MQNTDNITWNEVKDKITESQYKKSVLLGNGFTNECINDENFTIETLINILHDNLYNKNKLEGITNIEDYIHKVETQFISVLFDLLPEKKLNSLPNIKGAITDFLLNFNDFYTLNYDQVLYFLLMNLKDKAKKYINDGFSKGKEHLYWKSSDAKQNIFYLHGAFHLVREDNKHIKKIVKGSKKSLLQTIKAEWKNGMKSHIVIASDFETKKFKLSKKYSEYLAYGYEKFKNIEGILVTVGVSFSDSDKHIIDAINNNKKLDEVYIGYYTDDESKLLKNKFHQSNKIKFYCTKDMFKNK